MLCDGRPNGSREVAALFAGITDAVVVLEDVQHWLLMTTLTVLREGSIWDCGHTLTKFASSKQATTTWTSYTPKMFNTIFTTKSSYTLTNLHQSYNRWCLETKTQTLWISLVSTYYIYLYLYYITSIYLLLHLIILFILLHFTRTVSYKYFFTTNSSYWRPIYLTYLISLTIYLMMMACRHLRLLYHVMEGPTALVKLRHYLLGKRCDSRAERCTALTADDDTNSITRREYLGLRSHPDKVCIFQAADDDMNIIYTKDV